MGVAKHVPETIAKYPKMNPVLCQKVRCLERSYASTVAKSRHWSGANLRKARDALRCRRSFPGIAAQGQVDVRLRKTERTPASRLLKNYCATLIRACAVLGILMYSLCTLRFLRSGRTRLKAARDVFQQPASRPQSRNNWCRERESNPYGVTTGGF
jgi:hypothetical protein